MSDCSVHKGSITPANGGGHFNRFLHINQFIQVEKWSTGFSAKGFEKKYSSEYSRFTCFLTKEAFNVFFPP